MERAKRENYKSEGENQQMGDVLFAFKFSLSLRRIMGTQCLSFMKYMSQMSQKEKYLIFRFFFKCNLKLKWEFHSLSCDVLSFICSLLPSFSSPGQKNLITLL